MTEVELLKKMALLKSYLSSILGDVNICEYTIDLRHSIDKVKYVELALKYFNIDYEICKEDFDKYFIINWPRNEFYLHFGENVDLKIVHLITSILYEIYGNELFVIFIMKGITPWYVDDEYKMTNTIGIGFVNYIYGDDNPFSARIQASEIINLKIYNMAFHDFRKHIKIGYTPDLYRRMFPQKPPEKKNDFNYRNRTISEREIFNELTDGQYGSYDDWRESGESFDELSERMGH